MHTGNWSKTMRRTGSHRHAVKGNTQAAVTHRTQSHTGTGNRCSVPELARRKRCSFPREVVQLAFLASGLAGDANWQSATGCARK